MNPEAPKITSRLQEAAGITLPPLRNPRHKDHDVWLVASASWRKALGMALQLIWSEGGEASQDFQRFLLKDNPLGLLEFLKANFYNGNGALKEPLYIGEFKGKPVYVIPQTGELNDDSSQLTEAERKAQSVHALHDYTEKKRLQRWRFKVGNNQRTYRNPLIIGADGMDEVVIPGEFAAQPFPKPSRLLKDENFLSQLPSKDEVGSEAFKKAFVQWYAESFLPVGAQLQGVTAIAVMNAAGEIIYTGESRIQTLIKEESLEYALSKFDMDASLGGILQYLLPRLNGVPTESLQDPKLREYVQTLELNNEIRESFTNFLVLCQILGIPFVWTVTEVLKQHQNSMKLEESPEPVNYAKMPHRN